HLGSEPPPWVACALVLVHSRSMTVTETESATASPGPPEAMHPPVDLVDRDARPAPVLLTTLDQEPNIGRGAMIGSAIGCVVAFVTVTIAGALGGLSLDASIGIGAFAAF